MAQEDTDMMAFIGSVFNMIGSFINMVFGAVASVFHFVFSVLGGLLGWCCIWGCCCWLSVWWRW